jgi:hypothetical protein
VFTNLDILGLLQVVCSDPIVHAEVVVIVSVPTFIAYVRARSAAQEMSVYQSNMFVSAGFAVAVAVGL